jgi:hypothetical protein
MAACAQRSGITQYRTAAALFGSCRRFQLSAFKMVASEGCSAVNAVTSTLIVSSQRVAAKSKSYPALRNCLTANISKKAE